jgi:hypothetical protein
MGISSRLAETDMQKVVKCQIELINLNESNEEWYKELQSNHLRYPNCMAIKATLAKVEAFKMSTEG